MMCRKKGMLLTVCMLVLLTACTKLKVEKPVPERKETETTTEEKEQTEESEGTSSEEIMETLPMEEDSAVEVHIEEAEDVYEGEEGQVYLNYSFSKVSVSIKENREAEEAINLFFRDEEKAFQDTVAGYREESVEAYEDFGKDDEYWGGYSYGVDFSVARNEGNVLSIMENGYTYTGGAHGIYWTAGYNFDVRTGELLTLESIAKNPEAFREYYVNTIFEQSMAMPPETFFDAPDSPEFEESILGLVREGNWYFDREGLTVVSTVYELAPYAEGEITFHMPYGDVKELKEEYLYDGPFWKEVQEARSAQVDLNGDGTAEELFYAVKYEADGECLPELTISGKDFSDFFKQEDMVFYSPGSTFVVFDLDQADSFLELAFTDYGPSDDSASCILRFDGNELHLLGWIQAAMTDSHVRVPGDGTLYDRELLSVLETSEIDKMYRLSEDGTLEEVVADWYEIEPDNAEKTEHPVLKEIMLYAGKDLDSKEVSVKPEDGPVVFTRTDNRNWVEVKKKDGELLYLYLTDFYLVGEEGQEPVTDFFDDIFLAG